MNRLGELLEAERARRDLTLTDFARDVLGMDHSLVSRYVNGWQLPNRASARKIGAALGLSADEMEAVLVASDPRRRGRHKPGLGPPEADETPAWARDLLAEWERLRAGAVVIPTAHAGPTPAVARAEAVRGVLEAEGYRGLYPVEVEGDDLVDRRPPVVAGMVLWLDPLVPPTPGCVVGARVGGRLVLRTLASDGQTLTSAVPGAPPLALGAVEVVGVGRLAQVPL